jgi:MFS family permease
MQSRWAVLALLFTVRLAMAFQFQAVGAVAPTFMDTYRVALAEIGLLISIYLAPGIVFAVPGGAIGQRFGDKPVVLFGLALMIVGGLLMAAATSWHWQIGARLIAGIGGVLLNVLMSKMVTDWFAGKEIATAMAIYVNSWPTGIALALLVLPILASTGGIVAVATVTVVLAFAGLILLGAFYRAPPGQGATSTARIWPMGDVLNAVLAAGSIWGLYNAALGMVFGFGTALLTERGWSLTAAGSATSLVLWSAVVCVPLGGLLSDRLGKPREVMLAGFGLFALLLFICARTENVVFWFVLLGVVASLAPGAIMSLPIRVLAPEVRAIGMGLYFTMFYVCIVAAPIIAGQLAVITGTSQTAFDLGIAMLLACFGLLWLYERFARRFTTHV